MRHLYMKQGLRLNRAFALAFLANEALLLFSLNPSSKLTVFHAARLIAMVILTLGFLLLNERAAAPSQNLLKRSSHPENPSLRRVVPKLTLFGGIALIIPLYLLSGQWSILLSGLAAMFQMQVLGYRSLAGLVPLVCVLLYLVGMPLGYPVLTGFPGEHLSPWPALPEGFAHVRLILPFLPLIGLLAYCGDQTASQLRAVSGRVSQLQSMAATDALTGLVNRRQFNCRMDAEIARARRYASPLSLALFDIDDFKRINDVHGHPVGDRILRELSGLLITNVRESDVPARYGGEEFALILPETAQVDAYELLERLRALIERSVFCLPENPMTMTVSIGIAQLDAAYPRACDLIARADAALYEAKRQGKNRVVCSLPAPAAPSPMPVNASLPM